MDTTRSGRGRRQAWLGIGLAVAMGVAGLVAPGPAAAQAPGPGRGYYSTPAPERRRGDDHFRRDDWRHDRFRRDDWRHGYRPHYPYRPYYAPAIPYPAYRPGQWVWNGWGWVWFPGELGY